MKIHVMRVKGDIKRYWRIVPEDHRIESLSTAGGKRHSKRVAIDQWEKKTGETADHIISYKGEFLPEMVEMTEADIFSVSRIVNK